MDSGDTKGQLHEITILHRPLLESDEQQSSAHEWLKSESPRNERPEDLRLHPTDWVPGQSHEGQALHGWRLHSVQETRTGKLWASITVGILEEVQRKNMIQIRNNLVL